MNNKKPHLSLTSYQIKAMIAFGIIGWFIAAMVVQFGGPLGLFEGFKRIVLYLGLIALWFPIYNLIKKQLKLTKDQYVPAISIGTSVAALCDGIAMPWASYLYGNSALISFYGAAWILWFVGIGLMTALLDSILDLN